MALGADQGGSIRVPASWTGIVGLKPTWGLVSYNGACPMESALDHIGPMARTVTECAQFLEVVNTCGAQARYILINVCRRQILKYKYGSRTGRIQIFLMAVDP